MVEGNVAGERRGIHRWRVGSEMEGRSGTIKAKRSRRGDPGCGVEDDGRCGEASGAQHPQSGCSDGEA